MSSIESTLKTLSFRSYSRNIQHASGHEDEKAENVLIDINDGAWIIDFRGVGTDG
jgi:hypothetical protein